MIRWLAALALPLAACAIDQTAHVVDAGQADRPRGDFAVATSDLAFAGVDLASAIDLASSGPDLAAATDFAASRDASTVAVDLASGSPDLARAALDGSTRVACSHGAGWVAFRFHYEQSTGTQAIVDEFGLPDASNWEAVPVYSTSFVDTNFGGGIELASGNWILIRYSVAGLTQINGATFSVYARSYDVSASGSWDAWSPLYGDDATAVDAVSNYPYSWTSVDYTGHVQVGDDPGLTGIRLYPGPSSSDLAVTVVELCIDGY